MVADYTVPKGHVGIHAKTLIANQQDTVTFTGVDLPEIEILSNGAADIYVHMGAGPAAVAATDCWRVLPAMGATVLPVHTSGDTVVKLISSGTPSYSVSRT